MECNTHDAQVGESLLNQWELTLWSVDFEIVSKHVSPSISSSSTFWRFQQVRFNVEKLQQMTCSFACMADREQVEKFLLMEPPAMIPTLSPVQDLKSDFYILHFKIASPVLDWIWTIVIRPKIVPYFVSKCVHHGVGILVHLVVHIHE